MEATFWLERWRDGRTHFHQAVVTPQLPAHWSSCMTLPAGSRILVPLCGKSLDMLWIAAQGYTVLGVELSALGVEQFFAEHGLQPVIRESSMGTHYVAGEIDILCADIFKLDAATLASCDGVYDRAALVALPAEMRAPYVTHVYGQLPRHYQGLLITLDYPQDMMNGPPFSVPDEEVQALYEGHSTAVMKARDDILAEEPKFAQRGVTRLDTLVYKLAGRPGGRL